MAKYTAQQIAKWFVNRAAFIAHQDRGDYITDLKLQKILYYAQGFHLALFDEPLFDDKIYAWNYGPVVRSVYNVYSKFNRNPLAKVEEVDIDDETALFLERIQKTFGIYAASALVEKTHSETPYKVTAANGEITVEIMKDFFKSETKKLKKLDEEEEENLYSYNILNKNLTAYKRLAK